MTEERLIELETRFAYQEETLQVLNDVVACQQKQIEQLDAICRQLMERASHPAEAYRHSPAEDVPPHY